MMQLLDDSLKRTREFDSYGMWNVAAYSLSDDMSAAEIAELIETSDRCNIDICDSDYDWTTLEHEQWDNHDDCGYTYVEQIKGDDNDK